MVMSALMNRFKVQKFKPSVREDFSEEMIYKHGPEGSRIMR